MMEFCGYGSVGSVLDAFRNTPHRLTEQQIAVIMYQAVKGLASLHTDEIKVVRIKKRTIYIYRLFNSRITDFLILDSPRPQEW
jgi:serine/threonine protein kinase